MRPGGAAELMETRPLAALEVVESLDAAVAAVAGRGGLDRIDLSLRARALIRAGLAVRALIINALLNVSRRLVLNGRTIVFEAGIYGFGASPLLR
ncbi:MAG TPA: hypothetical protein VN934_11230 [Candidatus Tumulicola sp.]|nr:hypothetical protein [Candidatus Tumulicola sp.]